MGNSNLILILWSDYLINRLCFMECEKGSNQTNAPSLTSGFLTQMKTTSGKAQTAHWHSQRGQIRLTILCRTHAVNTCCGLRRGPRGHTLRWMYHRGNRHSQKHQIWKSSCIIRIQHMFTIKECSDHQTNVRFGLPAFENLYIHWKLISRLS